MKRREFITLIGQHHLAPEVRIALERHVGRGDWRWDRPTWRRETRFWSCYRARVSAAQR